MSELFGHTRDVVQRLYALRTPTGFVPSSLPGWTDCVVIVQISPAMGADFSQFQMDLSASGKGCGSLAEKEWVIFVILGSCALSLGGKRRKLSAGSFAYLPAGTDFEFRSAASLCRLLVFEKTYAALAGTPAPKPLMGQEKEVAARPFLGRRGAMLKTLLPDHPAFDMAVNIFAYQPGATLPFVETHVMEHGLLMLKGQGIYRLGADWHPVREGDVIWMAPYCPQWFVAMGETPASYIYYKDINRAP